MVMLSIYHGTKAQIQKINQHYAQQHQTGLRAYQALPAAEGDCFRSETEQNQSAEKKADLLQELIEQPLVMTDLNLPRPDMGKFFPKIPENNYAILTASFDGEEPRKTIALWLRSKVSKACKDLDPLEDAETGHTLKQSFFDALKRLARPDLKAIDPVIQDADQWVPTQSGVKGDFASAVEQALRLQGPYLHLQRQQLIIAQQSSPNLAELARLVLPHRVYRNPEPGDEYSANLRNQLFEELLNSPPERRREILSRNQLSLQDYICNLLRRS
jgi:hypothetical protein